MCRLYVRLYLAIWCRILEYIRLEYIYSLCCAVPGTWYIFSIMLMYGRGFQVIRITLSEVFRAEKHVSLCAVRLTLSWTLWLNHQVGARVVQLVRTLLVQWYKSQGCHGSGQTSRVLSGRVS